MLGQRHPPPQTQRKHIVLYWKFRGRHYWWSPWWWRWWCLEASRVPLIVLSHGGGGGDQHGLTASQTTITTTTLELPSSPPEAAHVDPVPFNIFHHLFVKLLQAFVCYFLFCLVGHPCLGCQGVRVLFYKFVVYLSVCLAWCSFNCLALLPIV